MRALRKRHVKVVRKVFGGFRMKKVALYARVSTTDQTTENQLLELREVARRNGWSVSREFIDHGVSGAKSAQDRPAMANLMKAITRREIEGVLVWDVSRLGRSLQDLVSILNEIRSKSIDLYIHKQGLDTSTPSGKMMFQMLGVFAEFEREVIRERINAGLARAKAEGKKLGRPSNVNASVVTSVKLLRAQGMSICKIAKTLKIGVGTTSKILGMDGVRVLAAIYST
jgi:DNA invertase Pin-like site-specific DNA recombinase